MKRVLEFLLVMVLSLTLLAGCTDKGDDESKAKEPMDEEPVKISFVDIPRPLAGDDQAVLDFLNEKFNIELNWVAPVRDSFDQTFSTMLAAQEDLDFFTSFYANRASVRSADVLREKKLIIPLNDLLDEFGPNLKQNVEEKYWDMATTDGDAWFIPNVQFAEKTMMWYREDWLDAIGYTEDKLPKTMEEFEVMLRELKSENPGNIENFYPLVAENMDYLSNALLSSFTGSMPTYLEDDGEIEFSIFHPEYKNYLETMNRWYEDGLLNPDQAVVTGTVLTDLLTREKSGVWLSWFTNSKQDLITLSNPDSKVNFFRQYPTGVSGVGGATSTGILSGGGTSITSWTTDEQRQKIMELMDWLSTEEGQMFNWYGIKDEHWVETDNNMVDLPEGVDPINRPYNERYLINGGNMYKFFRESVQTAPPMTAIARQAGITGEHKTIDPPDYMFPYDYSTYPSKDLMSDLKTMRDIMVIDIITGNQPVSYYDEWVVEYMAAGGDQYHKDTTDQFNKAK